MGLIPFIYRMKHLYILILAVLTLASCGTDSGHFKLEGRLLNIKQGEFYVYCPDGAMRGLKVQTLGRGFAWLDTGTHDSLSEASTYIEVLEKRQGLKVGCLEGIAYRQGWITEERMRELAKPMLKNQYGQYLLKVIDELKETGNPNLDY